MDYRVIGFRWFDRRERAEVVLRGWMSPLLFCG